MILIPVISALLYLAGGQIKNIYRWLMGVPIFLIAILTGHSWFSIFAILTYWLATSAFPYGEKSWLNFLGEWGKFAVCGLVMGLASIVVLGWLVGLIQGIVGLIAFVVIKYLDDNGIMKNPWVELCRGFFGTVVYFVG